MNRQSVQLDNRIYCLQMTHQLPEDLKEQLLHADVLYLQDKDERSEELVNWIEKECRERGIEIHKPSFC